VFLKKFDEAFIKGFLIFPKKAAMSESFA